MIVFRGKLFKVQFKSDIILYYISGVIYLLCPVEDPPLPEQKKLKNICNSVFMAIWYITYCFGLLSKDIATIFFYKSLVHFLMKPSRAM